MKILHTSDWHLGHVLYNYDRTEEQAAMLLKMADIVREEKPDVFLLCGDVYHTSQPSAAVQTMFANAVVKIHDANPTMPIIITAGNHDSSSKHEIFRVPWTALHVYTIGSIPAERRDDLIVEIPGKGFVIAVPYVNERNLPEGLFQQLLDDVAERNTQGLPVIMTAHTTVSNCDYTGNDNATGYTVGGIDYYDLKKMGTGYDYLALGHIHHAQFIKGSDHRARYSGTPLPISFDETFKHTVSIVEVDKHGGQPKVREIEIPIQRPLVTLPARGAATWEEAKKLLADFPDDEEAYIRLNVEVEDFLPVEANNEAHMLTEKKKCRFCIINVQRKADRKNDIQTMSVQEFKTEHPIDIAKRYAKDMGIEFNDDMKELFEEALTDVNQESRQ